MEFPLACIANYQLNQACVTCKRRKIKCEGNPCLNCTKKNIPCEFVTGKKRGPPQKKLKTILLDIEKTQNNNPDLCKLEDISNLYQQRNVVQLYFNTVGTAIPHDFRFSILEDAPKNDSIKCQLFIISAHVLKSLGQDTLSDKYKKAALSVSPQIFLCFNMETVVCLLMMVLYLGLDDQQSWFFSSTASNITKMLPQTQRSQRAELFANGLLALCNPSIADRASTLLKTLPSSMKGISAFEWFVVTQARIDCYHKYLLNIDSSLDSFVNNFQFLTPLSQTAIDEFCKELENVESLFSYADQLPDQMQNLNFLLFYNKFLLNWRLGNQMEATNYVLQAVEVFKESGFSIALQIPMQKLLLMPYYLREIARSDICQEVFTRIYSVMNHQGKKNFYTHFCSEVNSRFNYIPKVEEFLQIDPSDLSILASLDCSTPDELCNIDGLWMQ